MRAARLHAYGPPDVFRVEEVPEPEVRARDVLIRAHAASVNPIDAKTRAGGQRAVVRLRLPWTIGLDVAGEVIRVGSEVTRFRVGDAVMSSPTHRRPGTYAELVAIDEAQVAKKPERWSFVEAATLPLVGLTAWACLVEMAKLRAGQRVLIHAGAGGVGTVAIQLARHLGAEVATTASARNADLVKGLGASRVVDYAREDFAEVLSDLDVVLESLGGDSIQRSLRTLRRGGALASINSGLPDATERLGPTLGLLSVGTRIAWTMARARIARGVRFRTVVRKPDGAALGELAKLADQGAIVPTVAEVFPLERIADAHRSLETGRTRGKIAIEIVRGGG